MGNRTPWPRWLRSPIRALMLILALSACSVPMAPDESTSGTLMVSLSSDRSAAFPLDRAVVDGAIYVHFVPATGHDVVEVRFFLDEAVESGRPLQVESIAPFDLVGGTVGAANPFDTSSLVDGPHDMVTEWRTASGAIGRVLASFTVANGRGVEPIPPAPPPRADWYVSAAGDDAADGKVDTPFASIQRAVDVAEPGDVIFVRGGTYMPAGPIRITSNGTAEAPIVLAAYPGEHAIIDGSNMLVEKPLVRLTASHWHLRDLEIRAGPTFGVLLMNAEHNVLERLETHGNGHSGVHLGEGASFNFIIDCRSHDNFDPASGGENADGFAIKHRTAVGNTVLRSAAWNNSDDGFDLLDSPPQRIDQSVAFRNGLRQDGTPYPNGNGNGFKLGIGAGRYEPGGGHLVTRSVAWGNEVWGFNSNNGTIPITLLNNTAWGNGEYDFFFNKAAHVLINNLSHDGKNWTSSEVTVERNSWQLGLANSPFRSVDPVDPHFLWLIPGGVAVDEGRDVGLEYTGDAPDLGALELGAETAWVGTDGALPTSTLTAAVLGSAMRE